MARKSFRATVFSLVLAASEPMTCAQVGRSLGCSGPIASRALTALVKAGHLKVEVSGWRHNRYGRREGVAQVEAAKEEVPRPMLADRILALLSVASRPLRRAEIAEGLGCPALSITSALKGLSRRGLAVCSGEGGGAVWAAGAGEAPPEDRRSRADRRREAIKVERLGGGLARIVQGSRPVAALELVRGGAWVCYWSEAAGLVGRQFASPEAAEAAALVGPRAGGR